MQLAAEDAIEHQVNNALFPGRNIQRSLLAVEVIAQRHCRTKLELPPLK